MELPSKPDATWQGLSDSTTAADDAPALTELWDSRALQQSQWALQRVAAYQSRLGISPLDALRPFFLRVWRKRVLSSLLSYLLARKDALDIGADRKAGADCLRKASSTTWWEWSEGSTPFFWCWPKATRSVIRDGHSPWFLKAPPKLMREFV